MQTMIHIARIVAPFDFGRCVAERAFENMEHGRRWAKARREAADAVLSEMDRNDGFRHSVEYSAIWLVDGTNPSEADLT